MFLPNDFAELRRVKASRLEGLFPMQRPEKDNRSRALLARRIYLSVAA